MAPYHFTLERFFPPSLFDEITEVRVRRPEVILEEAQTRLRRPELTTDGWLTLLAAHHPARGLLQVGKDDLRLGNRYEYLGRVLRVLTDPLFDGILAPPDLIEDLLIVNRLLREAGGAPFLDNKVLVGCMQHGGIYGVEGEIEDRFTAYSADSLSQMNLDGGAMRFRAVANDERTLKTIDYCAQAISALNRYGLVPFIEPLPMSATKTGLKPQYTVESLARYVGVAAALGNGALNTWLQVPPTSEGFEIVARATTLPILLGIGEGVDSATAMLTTLATGLQARTNVRGAVVGQTLLFPGNEDPLALARALHTLVHEGATVEDATQAMSDSRDTNRDTLTAFIS